MKDDGMRLSFSLTRDTFTINDVLSGKIVLNVRGQFTTFNIDRDVLITHLGNLQEALMSYNRRKSILFRPTPLSLDDVVIIRENAHCDWTVSHDGETANVKDNSIKMTPKFDIDKVLKYVNKVLSQVVVAEASQSLRGNIIRRLSDVNMYIWKYKEHSAVVYSDDCHGTIMYNCLVDGIYHPYVIIYYNDDDTVSLHTGEFEEILTVPCDDSIKRYFKFSES